VFVIEELNRGNPAQIFGELLTLLENDKRNSSEALRLTHHDDPGERVHIPENLYVIGTMNTADRSLAIMDFAFRRRFGFVTLKPEFNEGWGNWLAAFGISQTISSQIALSIEVINKEIREDSNLGKSFEIGHSYFTTNKLIDDPSKWLEKILNAEIEPTLSEYWFDDLEKVQTIMNKFRNDVRLSNGNQPL
jgi:5-methylcytosine-specific restriction protein B